jgi:nitrous oxide reductase accessory protein NosL
MSRTPKPRKKEAIVKNGFLAALTMSLLFIIPGAATAQDDTAAHRDCVYCGMDREKFAHSRMLIVYEDGGETGTCSIRCAALELTGPSGKTPGAILVGDYRSRELIDARTAFWVIGGDKRGVMSARAKWAFSTGEEAERFTAEHGGTPASFEEALKVAVEDLK